MNQRLDELLPSSTFWLDGQEYSLLRFENGMAVCEKGEEIVYLAGHLVADGSPRRFRFLSAILP